jgi:uncharacterized membrane protein
MTWNLFLAFIPLALSVWLFRKNRGGSWIWWLGFLSFYAFLPNAPYLLTDVIHLIDDIRRVQSVWMITLVLIPVYFVVIFGGFEAYVISLINLGSFCCWYLLGKIFTVQQLGLYYSTRCDNHQRYRGNTW